VPEKASAAQRGDTPHPHIVALLQFPQTAGICPIDRQLYILNFFADIFNNNHFPLPINYHFPLSINLSGICPEIHPGSV
jgi:hypothetical protein